MKMKIVINGDDRTTQIKDWKLKNNLAKQLELTVTFKSGKKFTFPFSECHIEPTEELPGTLLRKRGCSEVKIIERAVIIGHKYILITYPNGEFSYPTLAENVEITNASHYKDEDIFSYLLDSAHARILSSPDNQTVLAEYLAKQLSKIIPISDTALDAYLSGKNKKRKPTDNLIYPFGLNKSQIQAVEQAFCHQLSVIEGPPGTGKTQTILNIIANILINNKSVAIVSNNNSAVENVYNKLEEYGLGHIVAKLGSNENKSVFFAQRPIMPDSISLPTVSNDDITHAIHEVKSHLHSQYDKARCSAEIDELAIELKYLKQWMDNHAISTQDRFKKYRLSPEKITDLMATLQSIKSDKIGLATRFDLAFRFGIINTRPMNTRKKRLKCFYSLQHKYYLQRLALAQHALDKAVSLLKDKNILNLIEAISQDSLAYLKHHLAENLIEDNSINLDNYRQKMSIFLQRFPIIGSTTYSILSSVGEGNLLDYVIIDEASQQDILPGVFALACARNVIIVGDRKQLPHVPAKQSQNIPAPIPHYDCQQFSLLDSVINVYREQLPVTLLKEHYRCHPKIIQFCNKQFYDNQLIIMTQDKNEKALSLVVTAKGNHNRQNRNLREIESLSALEWNEKSQCGFISPYNAQVDLSGKYLGDNFITATVHKFQGRECNEVIFSTVLDNKADEKSIAFVDDPQLINVAISRAKRHFTLVTGDNIFTQNNKHIAALIRYMTYYADNDDIHQSPVVSAFDLLYEEYDHSLEKLHSRLDPNDSKFKSEQIVARLIKDALVLESFSSLRMHSQVPLKQLINEPSNIFTSREQQFIDQGASCDFVIYYHVGKQPLAVIEVDGGQHMHVDQLERDQIKHSVLGKCDIALLRLRTIDSEIETKIANFFLETISEERNAPLSNAGLA